ncbi:diguanylate cyclase [Chloroflexus islandicus]|uniref:Diguanylate cyclase n=1 Tax=Chloroflexus islandicus TaxID=1707952 RepID=A0A178LZS4_9CHLR|nr:EAL domain-containing protein [Chloroflexus islandicus]OAN40543.1 diguanylate cyclase [Chloroflexus islandicus]
MIDDTAPVPSPLLNSDVVAATLNTLLECIAEIVIILAPDQTIRFASPALTNLLGHPPSLVVNRSIYDFVHFDDHDLLRHHLAQLADRQCQRQPIRVRLQHAEGGWRIFELRCCNRQHQPEIGGTILSGYDVTALLAADYALRNNELRYRQLLELAPLLIMISNFPEGIIRYCNPAGARIFGVDDPAELVNQPLTEFLSGEDHDLMRQRRQALRNGQLLQPARYHIYARDQVVRVVEVQGTLIEGAGEIQVLTIGYDVTDREEAERQLNLRARVLSQIHEAVIVTDRSGAIVYLNEMAAYLYGVQPEAIIGQPLSRLFTAEPLPYQPVQPSVQSVSTGWRGELIHRLPDGRAMMVDVSIDPLYHDELANGGALIVVRDITARKQAEERLRLLESVVVHTNDAVIILDAEPLHAPGPFIRYANAACSQLTGYATNELIGRSLRILHGPATDPATLNRLWEAMEQQQPARFELLYYTRAGEPIWVDLSLSPVTDEYGKATHFIALHRDISAQKLAAFLEHDRSAILALLLQHAPVTAVLNRLVTLIERQRPNWLVWAELDGHPTAASKPLADEAELIGSRLRQMIARHNQKAPIILDLHTFWDQLSHLSISSGWLWPLAKAHGALAIFHQQTDWLSESDQTLLRVATELFNLIADHANLNAQLNYQVRYDALTGLPNRNLLQERIDLALRDARERRHIVALLFIDLDGFKQVNDSLGHPIGDRFLKHVSNAFAACARPQDTLGRMGGDEFLLLMPDLPDARLADIAAQRLLDALQTPFLYDGHELRLTASIGISLFPRDGVDVVTLLKNADSAMHRAKELKRSSFLHYRPEHSRRAHTRLALEAQLRRALERRELAVYYQPQYDLVSESITSVEALVRWHHPQRGPIAPGEFVPIAEESDLIIEIGSWVLREACRQAMAWQQAGYPLLRISVNVSARQLLRPEFVAEVAAVLHATGLPAQYLELEITEGVMLDDPIYAARQIDQLRHMGVRIALDDFGTGYSSLAYLRQLRLDALKIDQAFVRAIDEQQSVVTNSRALLRAMINLAHSLGLAVVAEGVETDDQRAALLSMGCDVLQGYLIAHPIPADEVWPTIMRLQGRHTPTD